MGREGARFPGSLGPLLRIWRGTYFADTSPPVGMGGDGARLPTPCWVIFPNHFSLSILSFCQMGGGDEGGGSLRALPQALLQRLHPVPRAGACAMGFTSIVSAQFANEETEAYMVLRAFSLGSSFHKWGH